MKIGRDGVRRAVYEERKLLKAEGKGMKLHVEGEGTQWAYRKAPCGKPERKN